MTKKTISFLSSHTPSLKSGIYKVRTELKVEIPNNDHFQSDPLYFFIGSERYQIPTNQVFAVFPPDQSNGEYSNVLPHIELHRSTLPWERSTGAANQGASSVPWLALLLLEESEIEDVTKVRIEKKLGKSIRDLLDMSHEPGEDDSNDTDNQESPVRSQLPLLWIKRDLLDKLLPSADMLPYLSHVRSGISDTQTRFERAIIIANRIPASGKKYQAHLISLEGRLAGNSDYELTKGKGDKDGYLPILSLYSWSFSCPDNEHYKVDEATINAVPYEFQSSLKQFYPQEGKREKIFESKGAFEAKIKESSFPSTDVFLKQYLPLFRYEKATLRGLLTHLNTDPFVFGDYPNAPKPVQTMMDMGSIPMPHTLRNGSKAISWYRSPLVPLEANLPSPQFVKGESSPDFYLFYNPETDMLDVTYSSAWELGRLMMISSPIMAQKMQEWKLSQAQKERYEEQKKSADYIPLETPRFSSDSGSELSNQLKSHFESLAMLKGMPYHYLVPDNKYLPEESIRMFKVDSHWISSFLEGSYSVGGKVKLPLPWQFSTQSFYGVLLRSQAVDGYPALNLEPKNTRNPDVKPSLLRKDRLGSGVLLCLFDKLFDQLDVFLPAESLHFGFENPSHELSDYHKLPKDLNTGKVNNNAQAKLVTWRDKALRVINPKLLANEMGTIAPSEFSIQMLQGETKVAFKSDSSKWNKGLFDIILGS